MEENIRRELIAGFEKEMCATEAMQILKDKTGAHIKEIRILAKEG